MKAERQTREIVNIILVLEGPDRFKIYPGQFRREMTVTSLNWEVTEMWRQSHPYTAKAIDRDGIPWTLSLRREDIPPAVRSALMDAAEPEDYPDIERKSPVAP
jgi:hypothetical protein